MKRIYSFLGLILSMSLILGLIVFSISEYAKKHPKEDNTRYFASPCDYCDP